MVFDFHPFFDGLIGYESLKNLKVNIITASNKLSFPSGSIQMLKKYPGISSVYMNAHETKTVSIHVQSANGDFLLEDDVIISDNCYINSGIYNVTNNQAVVSITNVADQPHKLDIKGINIVPELNNFENSVPELGNHSKRDALFEQIRTNHLNTEEKSQLLKIILKFENIFFLEGEDLTFTNAVKHRIHTKDDVPIHTKSYRYPFIHREEVQRQIHKMLEQGIIRHSSSPWTSPVWIVPKKLDASGKKKWRLVIDYRKLNEKTIDDRYPIPNINDILDKLGRCMYFTTLDLASGFHQIEVSESDIQKTAFSVENGHYEFLRMPFGLKNAPSTFQRVMDNVLREHIGTRCLVYMDDIIVFSTSLTEHLDNLAKIFDTLRKHNLKIQLDKSEFLQKEVAFLGHIVTSEGVKPNPDKIQAIKNWPLPRNEKQLRGFLGVLGYYRKFVKDFARIAKPLTNALRKNEAIEHTEEFVKAFEKLKNILSGNDILQYPNFDKPFVLTTDASNHAIGAVLSQGPIGSDRPVAFASRTLNKSEENYSAIEKELLAIYWGCKYFRPYLFGRKFTLYTDHKPLTYGLNLKDGNNRLIHWRLYLLQFNFDIRYRPGKQNVVADGLSRIPDEININEVNSASSDSNTVHSADTDDSEFIPCTEQPVNHFSNQIVLRLGEIESEDYEEVFPRVRRRTITKITFGVPLLIRIFKSYIDPRRTNCIYCPERIINTIQTVYRNYFSRTKSFKIYISQKMLIDLKTLEEQNATIEQTHNVSHRGIWENNKQISNRYYFPKMKFKIRQHIKLCEICNKNKYDRHPYNVKLGSTPNTTRPLEIVHIDIFISQPLLFLSFVDKFSRFGTLIPIKSRTIVDLRKALLKFFSIYGTPNNVVSDNEPALKSADIRGVLHNLNINTFFVPANHSESNGTVERFHSTIAEIFRCITPTYPDLSKKELFITACTLYNNTIHSAHKLKPREVFFGLRDGVERPMNIDSIIAERNKLYDEVILTNEKSKSYNLDFHNKNRETPPILEPDQTIFNKIPGIKKKTKEQYISTKVVQDKERTFMNNTREIHKDNIKRI